MFFNKPEVQFTSNLSHEYGKHKHYIYNIEEQRAII